MIPWILTFRSYIFRLSWLSYSPNEDFLNSPVYFEVFYSCSKKVFAQNWHASSHVHKTSKPFHSHTISMRIWASHNMCVLHRYLHTSTESMHVTLLELKQGLKPGCLCSRTRDPTKSSRGLTWGYPLWSSSTAYFNAFRAFRTNHILSDRMWGRNRWKVI